MKFSVRWVAFSVLLAIFCMTALACAASSVVSLAYEDDQLVDKKRGIRYVAASISYEPVSVGEKYAECKEAELALYAIPGASPAEWLAEKSEGIGLVFHATTVTLPTLTAFEPTKVLVGLTADVFIPLAEIVDAADMAAVAAQLETGEKTVLPATYAQSYTLKFVSEKYPAIYYTVRYLDCGDNCFYLYDPGEKKAVRADGLLEKYLSGDTRE